MYRERIDFEIRNFEVVKETFRKIIYFIFEFLNIWNILGYDSSCKENFGHFSDFFVSLNKFPVQNFLTFYLIVLKEISYIMVEGKVCWI